MRLLPIVLFVAACGGGGSTTVSPNRTAEAPSFVLHGTVTYGARLPTASGASAETSRPADFVDVAVLDATGSELAKGTTAADGTFTITGDGEPSVVEVRAHTEIGEETLEVTRDAAGNDVHRYRAIVAAGPVEVAISDAASSMAGALHILSTLRRGLAAVHDWTGRSLPNLFVYWERGVTTDWSYYRGPRGDGRFCLELLGGDPGAQATTDTDEHDEAIILHELGHFVFDRTTGSSSIGGRHERGALIDPGVAWEEGRATWFATAVLGDPAYVDSVGLAPGGRARVAENLETPQDPRGLGSETSVAGILWDLSDGGCDGCSPDTDGDPVALGPGRVLAAMIDMYVPNESYGAISDVLARLESTGAPRADLAAMLAATGEPADILGAVWPPELAPGATLSGKIDGLTTPAPSGGEARPENGWDAVDAYRVRVPARSIVQATLHITGSGSAADHTDLELELRDLRAELVRGSYGTTETETVSSVIEPGSVIVYVRDSGAGNLAEYTVEVTITPIP